MIIKTKFSIVIPVYFNETSLVGLTEKIIKNVIDINADSLFEIIFVDDGSGDDSLVVLKKIQKANPHLIKVIALTRNFGQINAIIAGISNAKGDACIVISADGQDPVEIIGEMISVYGNKDCEIVICNRISREDSLWRKATSKIFYSLIRSFIFNKMPEGGFDCFLLGPRAISHYLRNMDANPFLQGQILWMGFKTKFIEYGRVQRENGLSRWTWGKKITYLIDAFSSYSFAPLRICSSTGVMFALFGFIYAVYIVISKLMWGNPIKGWPPLMVAILVIGGIQLLMLGIVGEYIWRILAQSRNRELYIIDEIIESKG